MTEITKDLYQFSINLPFMDLTLHQYLLVCENPVLISTGTINQAEKYYLKLRKYLMVKN